MAFAVQAACCLIRSGSESTPCAYRSISLRSSGLPINARPRRVSHMLLASEFSVSTVPSLLMLAPFAVTIFSILPGNGDRTSTTRPFDSLIRASKVPRETGDRSLSVLLTIPSAGAATGNGFKVASKSACPLESLNRTNASAELRRTRGSLSLNSLSKA